MEAHTIQKSSARFNAKGATIERFNIGSVVYARYLDHVLFKDTASSYRPFVREALGWLDHADGDCIRLVWERFSEPVPGGEARQRASGLVILRSAILELKKLERQNFNAIEGEDIRSVYEGGNNDSPGPEADAGPPAGVREKGRDLRRRGLGSNG